PTRADALEPARLQLLAHLAPLELAAPRLGVVELVLEELFMNLVMHAHGDGAEHHVDLLVQADGSDVLLQFSDDGRPFDPGQHVQADRPATLAQARPGGLGLHLVRRFARSITHWRAEGRNHVQVRVAQR
ncbi:MAG: ATP-binding protein, partial [Rubrivivax sp.]